MTQAKKAGRWKVAFMVLAAIMFGFTVLGSAFDIEFLYLSALWGIPVLMGMTIPMLNLGSCPHCGEPVGIRPKSLANICPECGSESE